MKKILIINDNLKRLNKVKEMIEKNIPGSMIFTAVNEISGLSIAKEELPDIIIPDLLLNQICTIKLCQKLREDYKTKNIPIIVFAASKPDAETLKQYLESGVDAFVAESLDYLELLTQIKALLEIKNGEGELPENEILLDRIINTKTKQLIESEKVSRTLIEHSPIGISVRDKNGTLLLANKAWQTIWGLSDEEVARYKKPRDKLIFDENDAYIRNHLDKIEKVYKVGGEYHIQDIKLLHPKKNKAEWVSQYFYSITDDRGEVEQVVILTIDISERKRVEEELRRYHDHLEELVKERTAKLEKEIAERKQAEIKLENYKDHLEEIMEERTRSLQQSEEKYRSVYENMHLGIYRSTPNGKILMVNPGLLEILKYKSLKELQKRNLEEDGYHNKNRRKEFKNEMQKNKQVRGFESIWKTVDGQKVFIRENAKAFCDKSGKILYYEGTVEDITERKKAEEELRVNRERLRTANSILRHDIANNLVVIKSALDIYREEHDESMLDEIDKRVEKSLSTIYKQKEQEKFLNSHAELEEYDIREVAENIAGNFPEIIINIEGTGKAYVDNAIYSVFENIISNAIIHGNTEKLDIRMGYTEEFCDIKFIDYGVGIPENIKPVIFDEGFHYGKMGHTGIGLNIVQKTVDDYGGIVAVENNKPNGAIFIVRLRRIIERPSN